jgi:hypothetical protein
LNNEADRLIYSAWRDSESYAVPATEEGQRLADQRFYGFRLGWIYAKFHSETGDIYRKDYIESRSRTEDDQE